MGRSRTRVSIKHQVTIPSGPFRSAGLRVGDRLRVEAAGDGKVVMVRVDELIDGYASLLDELSPG